MATTKKKTKISKPKKKFVARKVVPEPVSEKIVDAVEQKTEVREAIDSPEKTGVQEMPISSTSPTPEITPEPEGSSSEETSGQKDESIFSKPPEMSEGKHTSAFVIGVMISSCVIFFLGGFIAGYLFCQNVSLRNNVSQEPTGVSEPTKVPTPTTDEINLSTYEVQILNGSGVGGVAAKEQGILSSEGFNVAAVGNASSSTISKTEISAKKNVSSKYLNKLNDALSVNYDVSSDIGTLSDSENFDVIITLGSSISSSQ